MRKPKSKSRNSLAPEILQLRKEVEEWGGKFFDDPRPCPKCGSENRTRWDSIERIFCRMISKDGEGFDDLESIRTASKEELTRVEGIGSKHAREIKKKFSR